MPVTYVEGDPLLTTCEMLAFGYNARGRTEVEPLAMRLHQTYPAAFSGYLRRCRQGRQKGGELFFWTESDPRLLILTVRDSSVGATRLRHVQKALLTIARDYRLYNIGSLAIAPLGDRLERTEIKPLYETWFGKLALPVTVYTDYHPGVSAETGGDTD